MKLFWDSASMPKGVVASLTKSWSEGANKGRITLRGDRSLAAFFEGIETGVFEAQDDDGNTVAKADVTIETINLYVVSEAPDSDAVAEVNGSAVGAMPNGGLYA